MAKTTTEKIVKARLNWNFNNAFDEDTHKCFIIVGNSYPIKNELKELGYKYSSVFGWYGPVKPDRMMIRENDLTVCEGLHSDMFVLKEDLNQWGHTYWHWVEKREFLTQINDFKKISKAKVEDRILSKLSSNEYVGTVGSQVELNVTIKNHKYVCGAFGDTLMITFEDEDGNAITTFSTSEKLYNSLVDEDGEYRKDVITISGTVKKHGEYRL